MELSTYFRINASETGQFERTLIIADEGSFVSYLEGCTAPARREPIACSGGGACRSRKSRDQIFDGAEWYPGDEAGKGGIYNFVTKRGDCRGRASKISWTQVETGSAITWKYPSCILRGDDSVGEFYSIRHHHNYQQADTGTKMIHLGKKHALTHVSKGFPRGARRTPIAAWSASMPGLKNARNHTQCDSLLIGTHCGAHTVPYIESRNPSRRWSMRRRRRRFPTISCSIACARHSPGRSGGSDRQWFLPRGAAAIADGVRGRGAEAGRHQPGRQRRMNMLEIDDLHVTVDGKQILKGITLSVPAGEVHAVMGPMVRANRRCLIRSPDAKDMTSAAAASSTGVRI